MAGLNFHPLKVTAVERAAEDATCVTVELPAALRETFAHHAGQYVTVRRTINDRDERRTYSIVTAPGGSVLKLGIRRQEGGLVSGDLAANLRPGDTLEVGTPMGRFRTAIDPARRFSYVAFAAGSGITPILSLATDILAREPLSRFTLIYGNRNISRTMFLEETLALKNRYVDRLSLHFVMSREPQQTELLNGRIDGKKVIELARQLVEIASADEYLICGPGDMVDEVRNTLKTLNAQCRHSRRTLCHGQLAAPGDFDPAGRCGRARGDHGDHHRDHGRPAPQLSHVAERPVGAGGRGTGRARAALLLPFRHLRDLPCENHRGRRGHDAQHCAGALGNRRGFRTLLPGPAHDAHARHQLRPEVSTFVLKVKTCHTKPFCSRWTAASPA